MDAALGFVGAGVIALSACYYALDILRGETRPQRTSWAVWAVVGVLGFGTSEAGGAGPGAWAAGVDGVACVFTFGLSLHPKYGKGGGRRLDPLLGAVALGGVILWRWGPLSVTGAAACAVVCDVIALWPTVREAWRQPHTESLPSWSADLVGHLICLAAVSSLSFAALAFPLYMILQTGGLSVVLIVRRGARRPVRRGVDPALRHRADGPERRQDRTVDVRRFGPVRLSDAVPLPDGESRGGSGIYGKAGTVSRSESFFSEGGAT